MSIYSLKINAIHTHTHNMYIHTHTYRNTIKSHVDFPSNAHQHNNKVKNLTYLTTTQHLTMIRLYNINEAHVPLLKNSGSANTNTKGLDLQKEKLLHYKENL